MTRIADPNRSIVEEPLREGAAFTYSIAEDLCCADHARGGETCAWYHGLWPLLRLLDIGTTPGRLADFISGTLSRFAATGRYPRVLISGAADFGLAAYVIAAYRSCSADLELTVLDRCETPLAVNRWYGERSGISITTYCSDVLSFDFPQPYDLVMTNSFLGYFDAPGRHSLFAAWRRALRPGGKLITTNRLRPGAGNSPVRFTTAQAHAFHALIESAVQTPSITAGLDPDTARRWAHAYTANFYSYPIQTREEIAGLLATHEFDCDLLDEATVAPATATTLISGPTISEHSHYVRAIASRGC